MHFLTVVGNTSCKIALYVLLIGTLCTAFPIFKPYGLLNSIVTPTLSTLDAMDEVNANLAVNEPQYAADQSESAHVQENVGEIPSAALEKSDVKISKSLLSSILENINVNGGLPGLPIASPSRAGPDYYYHWVRDGALTISSILTQFQETGDVFYDQVVRQYLESSAKLQKVPNLSGGVGEPKFFIDGTAFNENWGRPQNDGPALRALVAMKASLKWPREQQVDLWNNLIKTDIEYVLSVWNQKSFDLWEELLGFHFFTSLMQYGSLQAAAAFLQRAGLASEDSQRYLDAAKQMETFIREKYLSDPEYIHEHVPYNLGDRAGLDIASIIGVLELHDLASWTEHEPNMPQLMISITDEIVLDTINKLVDTFTPLYPINGGRPGGIGRYLEDTYNGNGRSLGNPWFIATATIAEALIKSGQFDRAIAHIEFIELHKGDTMSEQINRYTGIMQGAECLTWSYSSVLRMRTSFARAQAL